MNEPKKRGRPPKSGTISFNTDALKEPEPTTCTVLVMHQTNVHLSVGKTAFRERAEIPVEEYEAISAGDKAAGRPQRLERIG